MRALAFAALFLSTAAQAGIGPVVQVDGGRIEGERMADGRLAFRAVPFAAPPVGFLRWQAPQPVRGWSGVRPATASGPSCAQADDGWNKANADFSSEDCLTLEISTATLKPDVTMPVLVWIHGGSNKAGGGAGTIWSSMSGKGIVLVSIQYRLGALGFMAHPALSAETPWHGSGNWGLMDQQAALRWVQRNIRAFGGDPARVTIAGESAGAQDVSLQTLSPLARGLYRGAIEESGTASFGFGSRDLATSERYGVAIARAAGAKAQTQTAAALRALPVAAILKAERSVHYPSLPYEDGTVWLQPTVDGHVLPDDPKRLFDAGRVNPGPLIVGSNAREIPFFGQNKAAAEVRRVWGGQADRALAAYGLDRGSRPDGARRGAIELRVATDIVFRCPARFVASSRVRGGQPTWTYEFDYQGPDGKSVSHASELKYVFAAPGEAGVPAGAPAMQAYWLNFVRTGNPNGTGLTNWPGYDEASRPVLRLGQAETMAEAGTADDPCALIALP